MEGTGSKRWVPLWGMKPWEEVANGVVAGPFPSSPWSSR